MSDAGSSGDPRVRPREERDRSLDAAPSGQREVEARAEHAEWQLAATEQLGGLGSYDLDVLDERLTWSDELFRIFGYQPGTLEPSYRWFLHHVHTDDRARVAAVHEEAVRTGATFDTEARIVRPDGQVRILVATGRVLTDDAGRAVRVHGLCRDVTGERAAHETARRAASSFETLIEAAPDAIVVVDPTGRITSANPRAERFFGYADSLVGTSVERLVPAHARDQHAQLRAGFGANAAPRPMAAGTDLQARRADGTLVPVDIALTPLEGGAVAAFVRDATQRRQAERDRRRVIEGDVRRRQALELNDNVVQGLVALLWELEAADVPATARENAERTLTAAQRIMSDLLEDLPDEGGLVRSSQVPTEVTHVPRPADPAPSRHDRVRVVIADDAADLRQLLRMRLLSIDGVDVVGEAEDGHQAVALCEQHGPDLVLLDLSMPELDGLQAAERIRQRTPETSIYVLSGYPADAMRQRALDAGADAYFEKRGTLQEVCDAVAGHGDGSPERRADPV